MALRSAFIMKNGDVCRLDFDIKWELGFTIDAKHAYIRRIKDVVMPYVGESEDVTTASENMLAQSCSPMIVRDSKGVPIDDYAYTLSRSEFCRLYLNSLTGEQKDFAYRTPCLFDVFFKPREGAATQALDLSVYKHIRMRGYEMVLSNHEVFAKYYSEVIRTMHVLPLWEM